MSQILKLMLLFYEDLLHFFRIELKASELLMVFDFGTRDELEVKLSLSVVLSSVIYVELSVVVLEVGYVWFKFFVSESLVSIMIGEVWVFCWFPLLML